MQMNEHGEVSEWLLFSTKWAICQQKHCEYKLHFDEMMKMMSTLY